jgi:Uma2 family endonuclease
MLTIQQNLVIPPLRQWHSATWDDYLTLRDARIKDRMRLFFNNEWMWVDMGGEGINHANISDLFVMLFAFWAVAHPEQKYNSFCGCLLEKPKIQACAPDLVLYAGDNYPAWQEGQPPRIDLTQWRVPDLVGEISDTTLAADLDEQKHLYAVLGIPEYWVIDVRGKRMFAFILESGQYKACENSLALAQLPIEKLEQTLIRASQGTNTSAAAWFAQEIASL